MKLLAAFSFVVLVNAQISQQRQSSLSVLSKLRKALPDFIAARDSSDQHISEAKQNASDVLKKFLSNVIEIKTNSLQSILDLEADTLVFGAKIDSWCWESNIPMLEGIMGWIGTDYSECIMQLDTAVSKIIGNVYTDFYKEEITIIYNYSLFDAFERRNIINNPQSIDDAISNTVVDLTNNIPESGNAISSFERYLNGTIPIYSECLTQRLNERKQHIGLLKKDTLRCVDEMKGSSLKETLSRKA